MDAAEKSGKGSWKMFPLATASYTPGLTWAVTSSSDSLWFSDEIRNVIGQVSTSGHVTIYSAGTPCSGRNFPLNLASFGSSVYFADDGTGYGTVTASGSVLNYSLFCTGSVQVAGTDLAVTSDGSIWMSALKSNPSGGPYMVKASGGAVVGIYSLPGMVGGSAIGPDGNVWFTDKTNAALGEIDGSGNVSEYSLPVNNPVAVTEGPDGNLWVFSVSPYLLARVTPQGGSQIYPASAGNVGGNNTMVAGPDDAIWYLGTGFIARQDVNAGWSTYSLPAGSGGVVSLAIGPDSNVWVLTPQSLYSYEVHDVITAQPAQISFSGPKAVKVKISEPGYKGAFLAQSPSGIGCYVADPGPAKEFKVSPPRSGTCAVLFSDQQNIASVYVYGTVTSESKARNGRR